MRTLHRSLPEKLHRCLRTLLPLATWQATQISSATQTRTCPSPIEEHLLAAGDEIASARRSRRHWTAQPVCEAHAALKLGIKRCKIIANGFGRMPPETHTALQDMLASFRDLREPTTIMSSATIHLA